MGNGASRQGTKAVGELTSAAVNEEGPAAVFPDIVVMKGWPWPGLCWYNGGYIKKSRAVVDGKPVYRRDEDTIATLKDMSSSDVPLPSGGMMGVELHWQESRGEWGAFRDKDRMPLRTGSSLVGSWSRGCNVAAVKTAPSNLSYNASEMSQLHVGSRCSFSPTSAFKAGFPAARFVATGMPGGMTIDAATGAISGAPSSSGNFSVAVTASNDKGNSKSHLEIAVNGTGGAQSAAPQAAASRPAAAPVAAAPPAPPHSPEGAEEEEKFAARTIVMGDSLASATGLKEQVGLSNQTLLSRLLKAGWDALEDEWLATGDEKDEANFRYIKEGKARQTCIPPFVQEQIKRGTYHGGSLLESDFDRGHDGMTLQDFKEHETAKIAKLSEFNVFALRAYTSGSFPRFNKPLRQGITPHPLKMTLYYLDEGLRKLRAVEAQDRVAYTRMKELYRGMKNMCVDSAKFQEVGGTEMACMSTTATKEVALKYASSERPLMFRYLTRGNNRGVSIQFLSLFPGEDEYLYPPVSHYQPLSTDIRTVWHYQPVSTDGMALPTSSPFFSPKETRSRKARLRSSMSLRSSLKLRSAYSLMTPRSHPKLRAGGSELRVEDVRLVNSD